MFSQPILKPSSSPARSATAGDRRFPGPRETGDRTRETIGSNFPPAFDFGRIPAFPRNLAERIQVSPFVLGCHSSPIRKQPFVIDANDPLEREAAKVADYVTHMPLVSFASERLQINGKSAVGADENKEVETKGAGTQPAAEVPSIVGDTLQSQGTPLDPRNRAYFESLFGRDFSTVQIHTGAREAASANAIQALAFTAGRHIVMGGAYKPGTEAGRNLLAHELTHVVQQTDSNGNATASVGAAPQLIARMPDTLDQTLTRALPEGASLKRASISFSLPANRMISPSLWTDDEPPTVTLAIRRSGLSLNFVPPLIVQGPIISMDWSGLEFSFATASVESVDLHSPAHIFEQTAKDKIKKFVTDVLKGTPVALAGYDPLTDPDLSGTLKQIESNFEAAPSSGSQITAQSLKGLTASATVGLASPIIRGTPQGRLVVSGSVTLTARARGSAATLASEPPELEWVRVTGPSIVVQAEGEDIARLEELMIHPGGSVTIEKMTLIGEALDLAHKETAFRVLGLLGLIAAEGVDRLTLSGANPSLEAELVPGVTRQMIESALTDAVRGLVWKYEFAIPGYDLARILGMLVDIQVDDAE